MNELVTIGLMTYNHEKYIESTIRGLLSQDYNNIELIILDDASKDSTTEIIMSFDNELKDKFVNVIYIFNEVNVGNVPANSNAIKRKAKGRYYFEHSGDDILLADAISSLVSVMEAYNECSVVYANMIKINDNYDYGNVYDVNNIFVSTFKDGVQKNLFKRLMIYNCIPAPAVLIKREVWEKYGYHDETIPFEDYEYWLRLSNFVKFYYYNKPIVLYRISEISLSNYNSQQGNCRLKTAIEADYSAKQKYIGNLSDDEAKLCWNSFCEDYYNKCINIDYQEGIEWIKSKFPDFNTKIIVKDIKQSAGTNKNAKMLSEWRKNSEKYQKKLLKFLKEQDVKSFAIYGFSAIGRLLDWEFKDPDITLSYIIDRNASFLDSINDAYTLTAAPKVIDAVVVVPSGLIKVVENDIKNTLTKKVWSLEDIMGV